MISCV